MSTVICIGVWIPIYAIPNNFIRAKQRNTVVCKVYVRIVSNRLYNAKDVSLLQDKERINVERVSFQRVISTSDQ